MMACGIATTSALIKREPRGHGITCGAAGAVGGVAVFSFTGSVSVLFAVAGSFSDSSSFATVVDVAMGAVVFFAAGSGAAALDSTAAFSVVAVGV
jgi:hypothetical protein